VFLIETPLPEPQPNSIFAVTRNTSHSALASVEAVARMDVGKRILTDLRIIRDVLRENGLPVRVPGCGCWTILLTPIVGICLFYVVMFWPYLEADLQRTIRGFDFPAIEARYSPFSAALAAVTTDKIVDEKRDIHHVIRSMTHQYQYTGCVGGSIDRIYGTNRQFEDVLSDYAKFLSTKPEWKASIRAYTVANDYAVESEAHATRVRIDVLSKTMYPNEWAKYQVVYEVIYSFVEPGFRCIGG
jgi:hypothetical protein